MAEVRRFPYKGRRLATFEATNGSTLITYEADQTQIDKIKTRYGEQFIYGNTVYIAQYDQGNRNLRTVPNGPAGDQDILNGISNVDLVAEMNSDVNFYKQATGTQSPNTTSVDPNQPGAPGGSTPANPNPGEGNEPQTGSGSLIYPEDLGSSGQDRIKFQALTYSASIDSRLPGLFDGGFALNRPTFTPVGGSVFLPIQSSITDQNSVGWEPDTMNPIEARAATISSSIMKASNPSDITGAVANNFLNALKDLKKEGEAVRAYLVGQAIGVNNLQSRLLGQVLNPNLELLFQGPQLRPLHLPLNYHQEVQVKQK